MKLYNPEDITIQSWDDSGKKRTALTKIFSYTFVAAKEYIKSLQDGGAAIGFSTNPQVESTQRGINNTRIFQYLSLDLDFAKEKDNPDRSELEQQKKETIEVFKSLPVPPFGVGITKNGLQPVWKFSNPKELKTNNDRENANNEFRQMVINVCDKLGIHSEADNICRVIRLYGSLHLKTPSDPYEIGYKTISGKECTFEEFNTAYPQCLVQDLARKSKGFDTTVLDGVEDGTRTISAGEYIGFKLSNLQRLDDKSIKVAWQEVKDWNLKNTPPKDEQELRDYFENILKKEAAKRAGATSPVTDLLGKFKEERKEVRFKLASGFESLDKSIDGFRSGALYIFAGLKKSGKSSLLMNILSNFIKNSTPVGFINTELLYSQFINRFVAISSDLPVEQVEKQEEISEQWLERNQGLLSYCDKSAISNKLGFSKELLRDILSSWVSKGVKVVCFDNVTTFGTEILADKQGWQILADLVDELVDFAKENKIIVFVVIHTKPAVIFTETPAGIRALLEDERLEDVFKKSITTNRRPTAADLYGGGSALSQVSGGVLLLWRPFQDFKLQKYKEMAMLILEDFRDGAKLSEIEILFEMEKLKFKETYSADINFPKNEIQRRRTIMEDPPADL